MHEHLLVGLVTLVALGAGAQLIAHHARVPSILALLIVGALAGPVLGWLAPEQLLGEVTFPLVSLGAAIILFEGGLTARFQDLKGIHSPVGRLVSIGLVVTWVLTAALAMALLGLSMSMAALLGAILVVTGPTVIGPILRHARPGGSVGQVLKFEGIINDPIGALLAVIVFQVIQVERVETAAWLVAWGVLKAIVAAGLVGASAAWLYAQATKRNRIPEQLRNATLIPLVLVVYAACNHVQAESGLLAVTVMGMVLASLPNLDVTENVEFAEHLRTMLISVLFVLLTARMSADDFVGFPWGGALFAAALILIVRPAAVLLSTAGTKLSYRERIFLAAMAPRGIVAAAVSSVFALRLEGEGYSQATHLLPATFVVIAGCVVVYGLSARSLARLLNLNQPSNRVLLMGDNLVSRRLAEGLRRAEVPVTVLTTNHRSALRLRREGYDAQFGHIQSETLMNRLDIESLGCVVALTSNDDLNTLASVHFSRILGSEAVAQVRFEPGHELEEGENLRGLEFAEGTSFEVLIDKARAGTVKTTQLTDEFNYDHYCEHYGAQAVPLLVLREGEAPKIAGPDTEPQPGDRLVSLVEAAIHRTSEAA